MRKHIRNERATAERFKLFDISYPGDHGVAWCEEDCSNEPVFHRIEHAFHALEAGTAPCAGCLRAILAIINAALKDSNVRHAEGTRPPGNVTRTEPR